MPEIAISQLFLSAETAIYNAMEHAEIQKKVVAFGYSQKRLQEGYSLLQQARALQELKADKYQEQRDLSRKINMDKKSAKASFMKHLSIAQMAFEDAPEIMERLRPKRVSSRLAEWVTQARTFYTKIEPYAEQMERYQVNLAEMQETKARIDAFLTTRNQRLQKKGEAEESTRVRNKAIKDLKTWLKEFRSVARIALKDSPQLLEALGMKVASEV